ncbi:group III truncated hemoglobin [Streptomyces sp. CRN 30]|uniref:group III truncated hemoglobin n=1 Tax=Streptomyces sp. CRN 30 TaxID=3075613 RepID=UPI002A7FE975|nr:group III truncated hemoglobin [Streptomyces sp. CRN 30]
MTSTGEQRRPATPAPAPGSPALAPGDIRDRRDVETLVDSFYRRVLADPLIGPLFTEVARVDWPAHLRIMADFWESSLLTPGVYRRNALRAHRDLHAEHPLRHEHFDRWLELWTATVRRTYVGPVADRAVTRARTVAGALAQNTIGGGPSPSAAVANGPVPVRIEPRPRP